MDWLRKLLGRGDREGAGGGGAWSREGEEHRANKQRADTRGLAVEGDPRGGMQDDEYRTADPRDVVEAEGTTMAGPGGGPQEEATPTERRSGDRQ